MSRLRGTVWFTYTTGVWLGVPKRPLILPVSSSTSRLQILVLLDAGAGGRGNLNQHRSLPKARFAPQELFEGSQFFGNALGVIEAIDADDQVFARMRGLQAREFLPRLSPVCQLSQFVGVDSDGQDAELDSASRQLHCTGFRVEPENSHTSCSEMADVLVGMKADEIRTENAAQQRLLAEGSLR